ncbi:TlpA family protein disulfide reductase [Chryseobacterium bernardetii]|uniref:TlpA family protein disulfide reductase n=1 Tax=Chryseobacterium bernardetii TaxID=1241978 RepID=A0A3G6TKR7_9FLAO|nr:MULTISPECIES: TlpA disulfide reductase family protein [Chryseobacterium]AZB26884.1 TlpA family protein disulfide reductase [Chryseobacterium bernardetii]MCS3531174.1 thiol-disulfide isomerase/thioredoxin [Chryseobacterium sp. JUb7]
MKKILFSTMLYLLMVQFSIAQKRTVLNIKFENFKDSVIRLSFPIFDGKFALYSAQEYVLERKDGNFHFDFPLKETTTVCIYSNMVGGLLFVPGTFNIIVNPGDSLNLTLRDNKSGLNNMEITGKGAEKLLMTKEVTKIMFSSKFSKKPYHKQNITERYLEVDRSLDIIDSIFNRHPKKNTRDFRLAKAQLVNQTLDAIMSQSIQQYNDSVATLFNQFIKQKKRITPLLDSLTLDYFGGLHVLPAYISLSNMHQLGPRYDLFRYNYPLEYASLVKKEFGNISYVNDYLLSDNAISTFRENWYGQKSKDIYKFYVANVNKNNPHFQNVLNEYKTLEDVLQHGKPFYNFNLPDTNGVYHSLKELKGKVVILDFWFTGCGACKTMVSELKKIEPSLKHEKIQFVSISVDQKIPVWKRGIGIFSIKSALQLYTEGRRYDHPIIKFAKVGAYPTLIVLDKQGRIVGIPPHPGKDPDGFKEYIKKCLK